MADATLPSRAACFHAHLAAENALKALAIARGVEFRRAHDLAYLHSLLPASDIAGIAIDDLVTLNPWTLEGRYPAESVEVSVKDVTAAARRVFAEVERRLVPPEPTPSGGTTG